MKTGASVTDSQGTTWTVGQELGRGTFARSFVARNSAGREAVLKVALTAHDFGTANGAEFARTCGNIVSEQGLSMRERHQPWLPDLLDAFLTETGQQALLMPRAPATLATRLRTGAPLSSVLDSLLQAATALGSAVHGNLRPENILIFEEGVRLADPVTTTLRTAAERLRSVGPGRLHPNPPEARVVPEPGWDTYALCLALYGAACMPPVGTDGRREDPPGLPREGLDKVALSAMKDRVHARLGQERANPRFAGRFADKLGAVLNRGVSAQARPSPPYRFTTLRDLRERLAQVRALFDPTVEGVGKVLLSPDAKESIFEGGDTPAFSTTVTVSPGVSHEDLASGLLIRDLDAEGDDRVPVPDARYSVKPHPSGRLRFDFELPELRPGRYTVRIAFTVKDSGHEPATTDGHFEVRPPPGYIPPPDEVEAEPAALSFPSRPVGFPGGHDPVDDPSEIDDLDDDLDDDGFPSPIAPSDPGHRSGLEAPPRLSPASGPAFAVRPSLSGAEDARPATPTAVPEDDDPIPSIAPSSPQFAAEPALVVRPGLAAAPSTQAGAPATGHPDVTARAPAPPPAPSTQPGWGDAGTWGELPPLDTPGGAPLPVDVDPHLLPSPEGMEDLPGFDGHRGDSVGAMVDQVVNLIRENTWIALGGVIVALVLVLALAGLLIGSCAG